MGQEDGLLTQLSKYFCYILVTSLNLFTLKRFVPILRTSEDASIKTVFRYLQSDRKVKRVSKRDCRSQKRYLLQVLPSETGIITFGCVTTQDLTNRTKQRHHEITKEISILQTTILAYQN